MSHADDGDYEDLVVEQVGARLTVTINRPHRLNALRTLTLRELCTAFARVGSDPAIGVVVLAGAGDRAFCAGAEAVTLNPYDDRAAAGS